MTDISLNSLKHWPEILSVFKSKSVIIDKTAIILAIYSAIICDFCNFAPQKDIIMETFFQALAAISGPVAGILAYMLIEGKRKAKTRAKADNEPETMLDDISYIQEIKHLHGNAGNVVWQQYDILLAAQHYDWWTMVDWAAYMESADINMIESVVVADLAEAIGTELVHVYNQDKVGLKNFEKLKEEQARLSIYGHSHTLNSSVQIVWFNQTRVLRVITLIDDEIYITKYVETLIRRTFGTKDAMKLAKPIPKE